MDIYEALEALPTTPEFSVIVGENMADDNEKGNEDDDSQVIQGRFKNTKNEEGEK